MKNKIKSLLVILCTLLIVTGCEFNNSQKEDSRADKNQYESLYGGYFTVIASWKDEKGLYRIVYANDTKVKYFIQTGNYECGITVLYNPDGSLQVYDGTTE